MRFTASFSGVLISSLFLTSALGNALKEPSKRQDLQLVEQDDADDQIEDIWEDIGEYVDDDDNEDAFEVLESAAEENQPSRRVRARSQDKTIVVVREYPPGYEKAEMGKKPAVGAKTYTEGLATCIGLLVSGPGPDGNWIHVQQHFWPGSTSKMQEQWTAFKNAVYGAGFQGIRGIISTSNPDQLTDSAAGARDQQVALNDYLKGLMKSILGADPEDFPHDANKAHQLPHGTIKTDGELIEINGQQV